MGPTWQQMMKEDRRRKTTISYTVTELSEIKFYLKQLAKMLNKCEIKNVDFTIEVNYYLPDDIKKIKELPKTTKKAIKKAKKD